MDFVDFDRHGYSKGMKQLATLFLISLALTFIVATVFDTLSMRQLEQAYEAAEVPVCRTERGHRTKCQCPSSRHYVKNLLQCTEDIGIVEP